MVRDNVPCKLSKSCSNLVLSFFHHICTSEFGIQKKKRNLKNKWVANNVRFSYKDRLNVLHFSLRMFWYILISLIKF